MKRLLFWISINLILVSSLFAQTSAYNYQKALGFPMADSLVAPYFCAVDTHGTIWVTSSSAISVTGINALFKAEPGQDTFELVHTFGTLDSVRDVTGLCTINDDVFVLTRKTAVNPAAPDAYYYPYSRIFYFPQGNAEQKQIFGQPTHKDFGTWYTGLAATKDGFMYIGQSYLVTLVSGDGRTSSPTFGNTYGYANPLNNQPVEPGGALTFPNVIDLIRDVAVDPNSDYSSDQAIVYTSRSSSPEGAGGTGGIAVWTGGKQDDPSNYQAVRVTDVLSQLSWLGSSPYGIAVDPVNSYLYACGTDSTRKWVKGYQVFGGFAIESDELPAATLADPDAGAPFEAPSDIAFSADGDQAYVADQHASKVFMFSKTGTDIEDSRTTELPVQFQLKQNYPNPFNPKTIIEVHFNKTSHANVQIFNSLGQSMGTLHEGLIEAGTHYFSFAGHNLPSGIYLARVQSEMGTQTIKMVLMK